ncbi:MAG TPA: RCC1 domain-containing protein, partial [Gemmatimonadales bacterium]|nr:RCC1 domain-containing protein [Gemmatimonadales bacterium]
MPLPSHGVRRAVTVAGPCLLSAACALFPSAPPQHAGDAVVLSAGKLQTCAITGAGATYCWGHNTYGELGDGTSTPSAKPVPVAGGHRFVALSAGVNY